MHLRILRDQRESCSLAAAYLGVRQLQPQQHGKLGVVVPGKPEGGQQGAGQREAGEA